MESRLWSGGTDFADMMDYYERRRTENPAYLGSSSTLSAH